MIYATLDLLLEESDPAEAKRLARQIADHLLQLADSHDFLGLESVVGELNESLSGNCSIVAAKASADHFPLNAYTINQLLQMGKGDTSLADCLVRCVNRNKGWRFHCKDMEELIRNLACYKHQEALTLILDDILGRSHPSGPGLDLIQVATEFSMENGDLTLQKWVQRNEQRLLAMDVEGGITGNSLTSEGLGWYARGVCEFGLQMAMRNPSTATGIELFRLEQILGQPLGYEKNPTGYRDEWLTYLILTPYPIERYANDEKPFGHENVIRSLKGLKQCPEFEQVTQARMLQVAEYDLRHQQTISQDSLATLINDYKSVGFPLPKSWLQKSLNEVAGERIENIKAIAEIFRIAKKHKIKLDNDLFDRTFSKALTVASKSLSYRCGMALLQAYKDGCPIPPGFFGKWYKHCSASWKADQARNFLITAPNGVLAASEYLRDQRFSVDLGL